MSKPISTELIEAIQEMFLDPMKLAAEVTVRVRTCRFHSFHFEVSSPLCDPTFFDKTSIHLDHEAKKCGVTPVEFTDYTFRQSLLDGTKCTNDDVKDELMVEFLLKSSVPYLLQELLVHLRMAFEEWPSDESTKMALKAGYANYVRRKIWCGTSNLSPVDVRVGSADEILHGSSKEGLSSFWFGKPVDSGFNTIELIAFSDDRNPCVDVVRQVYAAHALKILRTEVEPEEFPKIAERITKFLDLQAARLAQSQVSNPTPPAVSTDSPTETLAAAATSGAVDDDSSKDADAVAQPTNVAA